MPYGMTGGTSGMMGMGGMGLGPMSGYYSGTNMAASLLAQSKSNYSKSECFYFFIMISLFIWKRNDFPKSRQVKFGRQNLAHTFYFWFLRYFFFAYVCFFSVFLGCIIFIYIFNFFFLKCFFLFFTAHDIFLEIHIFGFWTFPKRCGVNVAFH